MSNLSDMKNIFTEENCRKDVEGMSHSEMVDELVKWRMTAPSVITLVKEVTQFHQFANSPEELDQKIVKLVSQFQSTIDFQDKQIREMINVIQSFNEDPLSKFDQKANNKVKVH
jgi:hypothetical protein